MRKKEDGEEAWEVKVAAVQEDLKRFFGEGVEKSPEELKLHAACLKLEQCKNRSFPAAVVEQNHFWKLWKYKQQVVAPPTIH